MNRFNTITITLSDELIDLFRKLSQQTGMVGDEIIASLLPIHVPELWEFVRVMEELPLHSPLRARVSHLLEAPGPDSIIDGIKKLDPTYRTPLERFTEGGTF